MLSNSTEAMSENNNCLSASTSILMSSQNCNNKMRFICEKVDLTHYPYVNNLIENQENNICLTQSCKDYGCSFYLAMILFIKKIKIKIKLKIAKLLIQNMDPSIDPCKWINELFLFTFLDI